MDISVTLSAETLSQPLRGRDGRDIEDMSIPESCNLRYTYTPSTSMTGSLAAIAPWILNKFFLA